MIFLTSVIVALFVFGNLTLGRPKDWQQAEKKISSTFWDRDISANDDSFGDDSEKVSFVSNSDVDSAPSTEQYVAFGDSDSNEPIETTDSTDSKPSTDVKASTDPNAPILPFGGNDVAIIKDENEAAIYQPLTIAYSSSESVKGFSSEHLRADSEACGRVSDPKESTKFVIYHVQDEPLDITVAAEGKDSTWDDFEKALQHAGKGYAVLATKIGNLGIINLLNVPNMSGEELKAYQDQGVRFFGSLECVAKITVVHSLMEVERVIKWFGL